jgi:hypothetical protein
VVREAQGLVCVVAESTTEVSMRTAVPGLTTEGRRRGGLVSGARRRSAAQARLGSMDTQTAYWTGYQAGYRAALAPVKREGMKK